MATVDVSVLIINWNRYDEVALNLKHLEKLRGRGPSFEVIVVDNGSSDGSADRLAGVPGITLVRAGSNLGPSKARNLGLAEATGRYVLFLDSDALLARNALPRLVARLDADPTLGVVGCRIVNGYTRKLDQWVPAEPAETHERKEFETYSFSGAGAIARRAALDAAGPFWDDLFIYNEEVDLSIRVIRAGYKVLYCPSANVFHFASPRGRGSAFYWHHQVRNWIWIFYRYYPAAARNRQVALYALAYLVKGALNRHAGACLSGIVAGLRRTDIIGSFTPKLDADELSRLAALGARTRLRPGR